MANKKISAFPATTPQASDDFVIARGSDNYRVSYDMISRSLSASGMETGVSKIFASGEQFQGDVTLEATDGISLRPNATSNTIVISGCIPCDTICKVEWLMDSWDKYYHAQNLGALGMGFQTYYDFVNGGNCSFAGPPVPVPSPSPTPSVTPSVTTTPGVTPSVSVTPTITPTVSPSLTPVTTVTPTPSVTPSISVSPSITPSVTPSISISPSLTPSVSVTPTVTPSITPDLSPTPSPSISATPWATPSSTPTPTVTPSVTPSVSISVSPGASPSVTPSVTPSLSVSPSVTPSLTPTATPSVTPPSTPSPTPSLSISVSPTPSLTATPSVTPSITPSISISVTPSVTPSITPSITVTPSVSPSPPTPKAIYVTFGFSAGQSVSDTLVEIEGQSDWSPNWGDVSFTNGSTETFPWVPFGYDAPTGPNDFVNYSSFGGGYNKTADKTPGGAYFVPESDETTSQYGDLTWNNILSEQRNLWFVGGNVANIYHDYDFALDEWDNWGTLLKTSKRFFTLSYSSVNSKMTVKNFGAPIQFDTNAGDDAFTCPANATPAIMWENLEVKVLFTRP